MYMYVMYVQLQLYITNDAARDVADPRSARVWMSGEFPADLGIPSFQIKNLLE